MNSTVDQWRAFTREVDKNRDLALAAAVQVPILVGAVFLVHLREGLFASQNLEFALLVLFLLVLTVVHGGGGLSADHAMDKRGVMLDRPA